MNAAREDWIAVEYVLLQDESSSRAAVPSLYNPQHSRCLSDFHQSTETNMCLVRFFHSFILHQGEICVHNAVF